MSSELNAELEHTLNNNLSNCSLEKIVSSDNSTQKIVDLVRGGVTLPEITTVQEQETIPSEGSAPEETEWIETLRNLEKHCNFQPVENSPRMVNQLTTY